MISQHHHAPQPYAFGYSVKDHHGEQHREESGVGGVAVKGSYGFKDDRGIHRQVDYVADHGGFKANVKTNEPGTANQDPAAVKVVSSAHPYFGAGHGVHGGWAGHAGHGHGYGVGHGYAGHGHAGAWAGHGYAGHGHPGALGGHGYAGHGYGHGAYGGHGVYGKHGLW
ncbi:cuticle protein 16.8 [Trichonephila inaurata madagascariensis]|uniref:Cuticle protein 16.8 n=1 Tax=Trichonephila inaurata madagascariensis TaxID=2747483 RepID=A0A8X6XNS6_9ARAC|nr:cuticle protein 16.8 [Trichonephila inaurata madagascariensis]